MAKNAFTLTTGANSTITRIIENVKASEKILQESTPVPPSEETVARLNAIAREYPFCAYIKQSNTYLL